jgi:DNA-binding transcriptional ArsR family regulator
MGTSKTAEFSDQHNEISAFAKALAHPARIAILQLLIRRQACICGDIVEELPLSQSTVSQHLRELKAAGLIKGDIEGVRICYCIDADGWERAKATLLGLFDTRPPDTERCC